MKVELKEICEQLTEALSLEKNQKVAACFENPESGKLVGWIIVKENKKTGAIEPQGEKYSTLKELFESILLEPFKK